MAWTDAYHVFAVEMFSKSCESVIATHRGFHVYSMLPQHDAVLN